VTAGRLAHGHGPEAVGRVQVRSMLRQQPQNPSSPPRPLRTAAPRPSAELLPVRTHSARVLTPLPFTTRKLFSPEAMAIDGVKRVIDKRCSRRAFLPVLPYSPAASIALATAAGTPVKHICMKPALLSPCPSPTRLSCPRTSSPEACLKSTSIEWKPPDHPQGVKCPSEEGPWWAWIGHWPPSPREVLLRSWRQVGDR